VPTNGGEKERKKENTPVKAHIFYECETVDNCALVNLTDTEPTAYIMAILILLLFIMYAE
jgi:hypothetical protein